MKVGNHIPLDQSALSQSRKDVREKESAAVQFEEIFAKHLVEELTKDSFKIEGGMMGNANKMYREFITDALASELAAQRKLGMADLVSRYWNQNNVEQQINNTDDEHSE